MEALAAILGLMELHWLLQVLGQRVGLVDFLAPAREEWEVPQEAWGLLLTMAAMDSQEPAPWLAVAEAQVGHMEKAEMVPVAQADQLTTARFRAER